MVALWRSRVVHVAGIYVRRSANHNAVFEKVGRRPKRYSVAIFPRVLVLPCLAPSFIFIFTEMHAALLVDEILESVLYHLPEWESRENRRALAQMARSCKAWQDPALDKIWMQLQGLKPLIDILEVCIVVLPLLSLFLCCTWQ